MSNLFKEKLKSIPKRTKIYVFIRMAISIYFYRFKKVFNFFTKHLESKNNGMY